MPLLVIFGAEDQIYDAEEAIAPYEDIAGVQTQLLEGVGHSPNVEVPEELAPLILKFADQADKRQRDKKAANQQRKAEAQAKKKAARAKRKPARGEIGKNKGPGFPGPSSLDWPCGLSYSDWSCDRSSALTFRSALRNKLPCSLC